MGSDSEASGETVRRRTDAERQAIVTEAFEAGAVVSEVAERHDVSAASIYLWRRQLRDGATDKPRKPSGRAHPPSPVTLVPVRIAPATEAPASGAPPRGERIEIALANGRVLRVCESIDPLKLAGLVAALESVAP
jgi:transposase-like protein